MHKRLTLRNLSAAAAIVMVFVDKLVTYQTAISDGHSGVNWNAGVTVVDFVAYFVLFGAVGWAVRWAYRRSRLRAVAGDQFAAALPGSEPMPRLTTAVTLTATLLAVARLYERLNYSHFVSVASLDAGSIAVGLAVAFTLRHFRDLLALPRWTWLAAAAGPTALVVASLVYTSDWLWEAADWLFVASIASVAVMGSRAIIRREPTPTRGGSSAGPATARRHFAETILRLTGLSIGTPAAKIQSLWLEMSEAAIDNDPGELEPYLKAIVRIADDAGYGEVMAAVVPLRFALLDHDWSDENLRPLTTAVHGLGFRPAKGSAQEQLLNAWARLDMLTRVAARLLVTGGRGGRDGIFNVSTIADPALESSTRDEMLATLWRVDEDDYEATLAGLWSAAKAAKANRVLDAFDAYAEALKSGDYGAGPDRWRSLATDVYRSSYRREPPPGAFV